MDDVNPNYLFQTTSTQLLVNILNDDFVDLKYYIKRELANRGLNKDGLWVGFDKAEEIHGLKKYSLRDTHKEKMTTSDKETIKKENLKERMFDCKDFPELWSLWVLLTKEQHADKEIIEWFGMRSEQLD